MGAKNDSIRIDLTRIDTPRGDTHRSEKGADHHQQMTSRLGGAVMIHAAAFMVAVFSLGSGVGIGLSANADSKLTREIARKAGKKSVAAVQAVVVESRGQTHQPQMSIVQAQLPESYESAIEGVELTPSASYPEETVVTTQYFPED